MKKLTLKDVAEMVFNTEWDCDKTISIATTENSDPPVYFGITIKNIFDCEYLIFGVFGGGFIRCCNWTELTNGSLESEDAIDEVVQILEKFLSDWHGNRSYTIVECEVE